MISKNTVLILGAGASHEQNFPLGRDLLIRICKRANGKPADYLQLISECRENHLNVGEFINSLERSGRSSVDEFLEYRESFTQLGKIAIARELIPFEDERELLQMRDQQTWYEYLIGQWMSSRDELEDSKLSILTFNYDRSLEYYVYNTIQHAYGITSEKAAEIISKLNFIYLHGKLGDLPFQSSGGRPYDSKVEAGNVKVAAAGIKIIHETESSSPEFQRAHKLLAEADVVCFLGFGYNPKNIERLKLSVVSDQAIILGTVYEMGRDEIRKASKRIPGNVQFGPPHSKVLDFLKDSPVLD